MVETGLETTGIDTHRKGTKNGFMMLLRVIVVIAVVVVALNLYHSYKHPETPLTRAISLMKEGKTALALPMLEDLSQQHPDNVMVYPWLAQAYLSAERLAEGRTALDTALRLNIKESRLSPVVLSYAYYYESKNDFEEAEKVFESATVACPPEELAEGKANLYVKWAQSDASKSALADEELHLEKALTLVPHLKEPLRSLIPHRLADTYRQRAALAETKDKDDSLSMTLLQKALNVSDEPATRMALGQIYTRKNELEKAIEQYQIVCDADANNLEARHRLVDLLCHTNKFDKAQVALLDLTDKEKSVENYQLLAAVDLKIANYAGAVRAYEDACDLSPKPELLKELEKVLLDWASDLTKQKKLQEAASVKGHADRVADQLSMLTKDEKQDKADDQEDKKEGDGRSPIALSASHIWLAKGSLTPEGEIKIKNVSGRPLSDLTLTAVFYDNTGHRQCGSVSLPVAGPQSPPFAAGASRSLYFSCPTIVKAEHQLAVIIFWQGRFLKEFPVMKQQ